MLKVSAFSRATDFRSHPLTVHNEDWIATGYWVSLTKDLGQNFLQRKCTKTDAIFAEWEAGKIQNI
jgi:hypothetical protein